MAGPRAPRAPRRAGKREPKFARAAVVAPLRSGPRAAPASMVAPGASSGAATASASARRSDGAGAVGNARLGSAPGALVQLFVFEIQLLPPQREAASSTPRGPLLPLRSRPRRFDARSSSAPAACSGPAPNLEAAGGARQHRPEEWSAELAEPALCAGGW